jgi:phenylacetate-coenzyme A ligase PaaK-like adenylate-forming protein
MADYEASLTDPALTLAALKRFCADPQRVGHACQVAPGHRYWVWESSGSTGEPAVYVQDEVAMAVYDALEATRRHSPRAWLRWMDPLYISERFAFVGATSGHFASYVSVQRLRLANPWLSQWKSFDILLSTPALVAALDEFRPSLVATYPTAALLLAEEALAGRLHARPAEVWTGGETLTAAMRERIESAFRAPLRNSYGASEFLPIAWECSDKRLHVNADWVILEPVDERGRPVPPGQLSHTTLITNLANHVQPLLRFDLGDRIRLDGERCPCGSALPVVEVLGRCDDTLVLPGREGERVALLPLALVTVLEERAGVFDFELRQTGPRELVLGLGPHACAGDAAEKARCAAHTRQVLRRFLAEQGAATVQLHVQPMPAHARAGSACHPCGPGGKRQRIVAMHGTQHGTRSAALSPRSRRPAPETAPM